MLRRVVGGETELERLCRETKQRLKVVRVVRGFLEPLLVVYEGIEAEEVTAVLDFVLERIGAHKETLAICEEKRHG